MNLSAVCETAGRLATAERGYKGAGGGQASFKDLHPQIDRTQMRDGQSDTTEQ